MKLGTGSEGDLGGWSRGGEVQFRQVIPILVLEINASVCPREDRLAFVVELILETKAADQQTVTLPKGLM